MRKKENLLYLLAGFVVTIVLTVLICLVLVWTGAIKMPRETLKIKSADATKSYDGTPLTASGYFLLDGELEDGHRIEIVSYGKQTEIGQSDNLFTVIIFDANGNRVTSNYQIIKICGLLVVYE